jgi:hypothetical protein
MSITLSWKKCVALAFLSFFMQETHELAHTGIGRLICGCWGERNFNVWQLCAGCRGRQPLAMLATWAGPLYSFLVLWVGYWLVRAPSAGRVSIGLSLVVSTMPISRVITPVFGGGDEVYALNTRLHDHTLSSIIGLAIVLLAVLPPSIMAFNVIGNRRRGLWFVGLLLVPFVLTGAVVFGVLRACSISSSSRLFRQELRDPGQEHLHGQGDQDHSHESLHGHQTTLSEKLPKPTREKDDHRRAEPRQDSCEQPGGPAIRLAIHDDHDGCQGGGAGDVGNRQGHDERLTLQVLLQRVLRAGKDHPDGDEEQDDSPRHGERRLGDPEKLKHEVAREKEENESD